MTAAGPGTMSESPGGTFSRALCVCAEPTVDGAGLPAPATETTAVGLRLLL